MTQRPCDARFLGRRIDHVDRDPRAVIAVSTAPIVLDSSASRSPR
jgi:hypothetical protein